jgi:cyclophilin family peptidyl-prolyl cis-trans isomerase
MLLNWRPMAALLALSAGLAACGGSDSADPTVNSMAATTAAYGRTAVWTVSGLNLDKGIAFSITSGTCQDVAEIGEGTAYQKQFGCRVASLGELIGKVDKAGGGFLGSLRVIVPQPTVRLATTLGNIDLELDPEKAPVTVNNFLNYVNSGFYNNTIFHRVIAEFVIQGGGYSPGTPNPVPKTPTQPAIKLESNNGLANVRGSLAMARTSDPDSATSQYYINVVDNPALDYKSAEEPGYAVFGRVTAGLDVVDAISVVPTRAVPSLGLTNLPQTNVVVTARQLQ